MTTEQIYATCVSVDGRGVVLRGPSGSGKSDLALRLIEQGGALVADDRVDLRLEGDKVFASSPSTIAGQIEVRGLGILSIGYQEETSVDLIVDLVEHADVPRLPEDSAISLLGLKIRQLRLHAFDASTALKIRLALTTPKDAKITP